jgi:flagellar biosynthetic protein FlhB
VVETCGLREMSINHTTLIGRWIGMQLILAAGIASAAVLSVTMAVGVLQAGFRVTTVPLAFNWGRLAWSQGWTKLFSTDSVVRTLTMFLKLTLITLVAGWAAVQELETLQIGALLGFPRTLALGSTVVSRVLWSTAAGALALGLADYAWQRWRREQRLKMSKADLRQEQKEDGGDPQIRARIRRLQREVAKRKGLKDVAGATVVLTNPTHYAVALKYDRTTSAAPRVVAKGSGALAKMIVQLAKKNGVPVLERKPLCRALYKFVEIGKEIPSDFYAAVAEILAFLYRQKRAG